MEIDGQIGENSENKPESPENKTGGPRAGQGKGVMHYWRRDLVVSVVAPALIIIFLSQPVRVEGTSMLPMLEDQDRLFINKMAYRLGEIHPGVAGGVLDPRG